MFRLASEMAQQQNASSSRYLHCLLEFINVKELFDGLTGETISVELV